VCCSVLQCVAVCFSSHAHVSTMTRAMGGCPCLGDADMLQHAATHTSAPTSTHRHVSIIAQATGDRSFGGLTYVATRCNTYFRAHSNTLARINNGASNVRMVVFGGARSLTNISSLAYLGPLHGPRENARVRERRKRVSRSLSHDSFP